MEYYSPERCPNYPGSLPYQCIPTQLRMFIFLNNSLCIFLLFAYLLYEIPHFGISWFRFSRHGALRRLCTSCKGTYLSYFTQRIMILFGVKKKHIYFFLVSCEIIVNLYFYYFYQKPKIQKVLDKCCIGGLGSYSLIGLKEYIKKNQEQFDLKKILFINLINTTKCFFFLITG